MTKKNPEVQYTPETHERYAQQKIIEISYWKAVSIVAGAVLVSIVGTAFTIGSTLNSDHFLLARTVDKVDELDQTTVKEDVYEIQQRQILQELREIKEQLAIKGNT